MIFGSSPPSTSDWQQLLAAVRSHLVAHPEHFREEYVDERPVHQSAWGTELLPVLAELCAHIMPSGCTTDGQYILLSLAYLADAEEPPPAVLLSFIADRFNEAIVRLIESSVKQPVDEETKFELLCSLAAAAGLGFVNLELQDDWRPPWNRVKRLLVQEGHAELVVMLRSSHHVEKLGLLRRMSEGIGLGSESGEESSDAFDYLDLAIRLAEQYCDPSSDDFQKRRRTSLGGWTPVVEKSKKEVFGGSDSEEPNENDSGEPLGNAQRQSHSDDGPTVEFRALWTHFRYAISGVPLRRVRGKLRLNPKGVTKRNSLLLSWLDGKHSVLTGRWLTKLCLRTTKAYAYKLTSCPHCREEHLAREYVLIAPLKILVGRSFMPKKLKTCQNPGCSGRSAYVNLNDDVAVARGEAKHLGDACESVEFFSEFPRCPICAAPAGPARKVYVAADMIEELRVPCGYDAGNPLSSDDGDRSEMIATTEETPATILAEDALNHIQTVVDDGSFARLLAQDPQIVDLERRWMHRTIRKQTYKKLRDRRICEILRDEYGFDVNRPRIH